MAEDIDFELDREKYQGILKNHGLRAALTELHKQMWDMEFESFEGPRGYQPERWERIKKYRALSRELWDLAERERAAQSGAQ